MPEPTNVEVAERLHRDAEKCSTRAGSHTKQGHTQLAQELKDRAADYRFAAERLEEPRLSETECQRLEEIAYRCQAESIAEDDWWDRAADHLRDLTTKGDNQ